MSDIRATNVIKDQLAEEDRELVSDLRELSRQLRNFVDEMGKVTFTLKLREWSGTDRVN